MLFGKTFNLLLVAHFSGSHKIVTYCNERSFYRRIPNAEHQCIGHLISIVLTIQSFYLSVYEVKTDSIDKQTSYVFNGLFSI